MTRCSHALRKLAEQHAAELSQHEVLSHVWPQLSLVLKGSVARGNADRYSDIDFVLFCDETVRHELIDGYRQHGLTQRSDGIFMPLGNWIGHYHVESFQQLTHYFAQQQYAQVWEYQHVIPLHDPGEQYACLVTAQSELLFTDALPAIKQQYLDLQLTLDWMMHPLQRGEHVTVSLHGLRILQGLCRLCYLLDHSCYPHDKWLFTYLGETRFGRAHKPALRDYHACLATPIRKGQDLFSYPQYAQAGTLIAQIGKSIKRQFGDQPWLGEWYLYV
jgi:hypothetical protein